MQGPAELQGLLSSLDLRVKPEDDKGNDLRVRPEDDRRVSIRVRPKDENAKNCPKMTILKNRGSYMTR